MLMIAFAALVVVALLFALRFLARDETAERRLKRHEYEPLAKHIWWQ